MTAAQAVRSHTGAWIVRGDGPSRRYSTMSLATRAVAYRDVHGGLSEGEADQFMRDGDWYTAKCGRCGASLERGGGEMLANGGILRCGSSFITSAMLRRDFEIYQPHFDAECILTPTLQGLWARYRNQPALNDKQYKRAILVDSATGTVHERTCGEEFAADLVAADTFVVEIFDSLCGYVGMDIYRWGRPEPGMWVQGQVRPNSNDSERQAWLRSTYADREYIDHLNAAVRPLATSRVWEQAEKDMRKQLLKAYHMEGLV